jgi:hypothetical protein
MSNGLKKWFQEKWVDIGAPKKGGKYQECGRKSTISSNRGPKKMKYGKMVKAYTGRAIKQPTETKKEFEMRHEYHTATKGMADYLKDLL